jgi:hypothetical protein
VLGTAVVGGKVVDKAVVDIPVLGQGSLVVEDTQLAGGNHLLGGMGPDTRLEVELSVKTKSRNIKFVLIF